MTTRPRATDTNSADETIRDSLLVLLQLPLSSMGNKQAAELTSKLKKVLLAAKRKSATADQLGLMLHLLNSDHAPLNRLFCSADIHQVFAAAANIEPQHVRTESLIEAINLCYRALNLECMRRGIQVRDIDRYKEIITTANNALASGRKQGAKANQRKAEERKEVLRPEAISLFSAHPTPPVKTVVLTLSEKHSLAESTVARLIRGTKAEALAKLGAEKSPQA